MVVPESFYNLDPYDKLNLVVRFMSTNDEGQYQVSVSVIAEFGLSAEATFTLTVVVPLWILPLPVPLFTAPHGNSNHNI